MPAQEAAQGAATGNAQQRQQPSIFGAISRMMLFYFVISYFFGGKSTPKQYDETGKLLPPYTQAWKPGQEFVRSMMRFSC